MTSMIKLIALFLTFGTSILLCMEKPITKRPYAICGTHLNGQPIDIDVFDPTWTPMHQAACRSKDLPILKELIEEAKKKGQTLDPKDRFDQSPAFWAAKLNNAEGLALLLENGASVAAHDVWGRNVASIAFSSKLKAIVNAHTKEQK